MEHLAEHLRRHVERVRHVSRAAGASAYLPCPWPGASEPLLLHTGGTPPPAELESLDRAQQFHRRHLDEGASDEAATADMRIVPSATPGAVLLPIPCASRLAVLPSVSPSWGRRQSDHDPVPLAGWLGLRFADNEWAGAFSTAEPGAATLVLGLANSLARTFVTLYALGSDPLTGLPGRAELHGVVRDGLAHAAGQKRPFSLLLVNPCEVERLNERFGRAAGDHALREMVVRLQGALRAGDAVMRYGGAIFAVILPGTSDAHAAAVAEKVRRELSGGDYLSGRAQLRFSVGAATWQPDEDPLLDPVLLIHRADVALALAKDAGGGRSETWTPDSAGGSSAPRVDRLSGVFTGDQNKDYRNLALLWDALTVAWAGGSAADLAARLADQLLGALRMAFVGIYELSNGALGSVALAARTDADALPGSHTGSAPNAPAASDLELLRQACVTGSPQHALVRDGECVLAIPVRASSEVIAGLLMTGPAARIRAGVSDLTFLEGFAAAIGVAVDRARLAEQDRERSERERRRLAGELRELRTVLRQVKLVYNSPAVEDVVFNARRVADTDATVLISGESGTGKGLLAETIHQVSRRRNKPFVIVDCGAIPASLIESELFGYERGAFTGAVTRNPGRIVQADGGTLLLDEVGEIPLEVQAKLLRFVDDHDFTSVGSHQRRHVDVRVLAATNRDLTRDVEAGRFRLDLFHRLSVVPLELPPLRDRDDDVLMLARHFLATFATKYQKPVHRLSPELEQRMLAYRWPGNVRELQNRLLRAVLLADGEALTPEHMPLQADGVVLALEQSRVGGTPPQTARTASVSESAPEPWRHAEACPAGAAMTLREALACAARAAADAPPRQRPPLGRWLADGIVLAALAECDGVARRAAAAVGLPETTYARRLERAQRDAGLSARPEYWAAVHAAVVQAVRQRKAQPVGTSLLDVAEACLIEEIERCLPGDPRAGAMLLGTSTITFRRRLTALPLAS